MYANVTSITKPYHGLKFRAHRGGNTPVYYSTITSFYHIWSRERAKYETVLHCRTEQIRTDLEFSMNEIVFNKIQSPRIQLVIACLSSFRLYNQIKDIWLAFCVVYIVRKRPEGQMMLFLGNTLTK